MMGFTEQTILELVERCVFLPFQYCERTIKNKKCCDCRQFLKRYCYIPRFLENLSNLRSILSEDCDIKVPKPLIERKREMKRICVYNNKPCGLIIDTEVEAKPLMGRDTKGKPVYGGYEPKKDGLDYLRKAFSMYGRSNRGSN